MNFYERADISNAELNQLRAELAEAKAKNARLRAALEWYADERNYSDECAPGKALTSWHFELDAGDIAREALKDAQKDGEE